MTSWPDAIQFHGRTWWRSEILGAYPIGTHVEYSDRDGWLLWFRREESPWHKWIRGTVSRLCSDRKAYVSVVSVPHQTLADTLGFLDAAMTEVGL